MDKTEKIVSAIPSAAELEQLAELHKAMGDHTRMRILWHLTQKEYCVSDLAKEIGVTESALSHQLRALRIVRLVRSRKEGKKVIYSLQDEHIGWVLEETYAPLTLFDVRRPPGAVQMVKRRKPCLDVCASPHLGGGA